MIRKFSSSVAAGTAAVLLGSTVAFASIIYDGSDFLEDDIVIELSSRILPDDMSYIGDLNDALDSNEFQFFNNANDALLAYQQVDCQNPMLDDSSGDSVITCDPFPLINGMGDHSGLTATAQLRVWSGKALTRYVVTLQNTTQLPINYSWGWYLNYGSSPALHATSSQFPFSSEDAESVLWDEAELAEQGAHWSMSSGDPEVDRMRDLPSTIAWGNVVGGPGAEFFETDGDELWVWNDSDDGEQLSLAAGESISFAVFNYAISLADFTDNAAPFNGEIPIARFDETMEALYDASTEVFGGDGREGVSARAIPCDTLFVGVNASDIANWDCTDSDSGVTPPILAATATPKLATTGANVEWLMVAGFIALIAGASFLAVSRRKRTA